MVSLQLTPYIDNSATMGTFIGDRNGEKYFFHDAVFNRYIRSGDITLVIGKVDA